MLSTARLFLCTEYPVEQTVEATLLYTLDYDCMYPDPLYMVTAMAILYSD